MYFYYFLKKGVCSQEINTSDMTAQFTNLGIQCVKKKESPDSLKIREEIRVDPFKQGFAHRNSGMNLNAVRLCFQVFLRNGSTLGMISNKMHKYCQT